MDKKEIFTAGIFYTALLAFLLTGVGFIISPLKEDIRENKSAIAEVRTELTAEIRELRQLIIALMGKEKPQKTAEKDKQAKTQ